MTAQMHDRFLMQGKTLSMTGVNGGSLFHPGDHGMLPLLRVTSCWRAYVCTYQALHDKLVLESLQVNLGQAGPPIKGIQPVFTSTGMFDNNYNELDLPMEFSGTILVAEGFIQKLYVHMGFQPAWKFETVFELTFSQGTLLDTRDVSRQMAGLRDKMARHPDQSGPDAFW